jgi:hypothetical protein
MAKFSKQIEFTAYQFNPTQVKGLDDYDIEDIIIAALEINDPIKTAFVNPQGKLIVTLYTYGGEYSKETFELDPGEWLTNKGTAEYAVLTDEKFKELTAVR